MITKIQKIGNQTGIVLPKKMLAEYNLKEGDELVIGKEGSALTIRKPPSEFSDWAEAYRHANIDYKDVLKDLAND